MVAIDGHFACRLLCNVEHLLLLVLFGRSYNNFFFFFFSLARSPFDGLNCFRFGLARPLSAFVCLARLSTFQTEALQHKKGFGGSFGGALQLTTLLKGEFCRIYP